VARYRNAGVPRVPELFRGRAPGRSSVREFPALRLCVVAQNGTYTPLPGRFMSPDAGFATLFPDGFDEVLAAPESVLLEGLATTEAAHWESPERDLEVRWRKKLVRANRIARVTALFRDPAAMQVEAPWNCPPGESSVSMKFCGGFRPGLAVTLTKRERTIKLLVCFGCGDVAVLRLASGVRVGLGWADIESTRERWRSAFGALAPVAQPLSPGSRCASNASASLREKARCAEWPSDLATRSI
jgi:hypothetical protein